MVLTDDFMRVGCAEAWSAKDQVGVLHPSSESLPEPSHVRPMQDQQQQPPLPPSVSLVRNASVNGLKADRRLSSRATNAYLQALPATPPQASASQADDRPRPLHSLTPLSPRSQTFPNFASPSRPRPGEMVPDRHQPYYSRADPAAFKHPGSEPRRVSLS